MEKVLHKKSGNMVSLLGFGCMRFPKVYPDKEDIHWENAEKLIDYAYNNGVNYFDTAYVYHNGESERFIGNALKKYPRESFYLADKFPGWESRGHSAEGARAIFEEQLNKCRVEYFDYYLLHSINTKQEFEEWYVNSGVLEYLFSEKQTGRIKNLGFSFHGDAELMKYLVPIKSWDFVQIQLNYLDYKVYDTKILYETLTENNIQCIIMEPVRGGALATLTEEACKILQNYSPENSVASWALRYAASFPNVLTVLSGMSNIEQTEDNVNTFKDFKRLNQAEYDVLEKALNKYLERDMVLCTACRYCINCPTGVDIPGIFSVYNEFSLAGKLPIGSNEFADKNVAKMYHDDFVSVYNQKILEDKRADKCIACGDCVKHCPQNIGIPEMMKKISDYVNK